jgi:general stress protein 26
MTDNIDARAKITELIKDARICMLATMTEDGRHVSRPMALQEVEFDGDLWFFVYADSNKARQIQADPAVNVSFSDSRHNSWVSLAGTAVRIEDRAKAAELWNPLLKAWFPDGLDTPGIALMKVHAMSAEYWESAHSSRVVELIGYAKAAVTGTPPDAGENREVRL